MRLARVGINPRWVGRGEDSDDEDAGERAHRLAHEELGEPKGRFRVTAGRRRRGSVCHRVAAFRAARRRRAAGAGAAGAGAVGVRACARALRKDHLTLILRRNLAALDEFLM